MDLPRCGLLSVSWDRSVPLKKIDTEVSIQGFIANVRAELHYINDSNEALETKFMFPMDSDSALYKFEAEIDGRTIVAEVQERSQAETTYCDALGYGDTAVYMGEEENAGDLFCMRLGNLPSKTAAKLSFAYIQELDLSRDQIGTFMLPTVINPRYMPDCTPTDESKVEGNEDDISAHAQQTLTFASDDGMLYCTDFTIHFTLHVAGGKNLTVFEDKIVLEILADNIEQMMTTSKKLKTGSDFSVSVHYKGFDKPRTVVERGNKDSQSAFLSSDILMVSFVPEIDVTRDIPCEFVFIIDRSGSMQGDRIEKAKETLLLLLKSLPVNCIFNIVSFGSTYSSLFSESKPYNKENLKKALDKQRKMRADMGGTNIFKPLESILENKPSYSRQIFLLTDGMVYHVQSIVDLVRNQKNTRIFTFGIGDGCSTELVRDLAKASNGKPTFVKDNDRLQSKVMSVLKSSMTSGITDVKLDWNLPKNCSVINIPEEVPTLFPGEKNILYGIIMNERSEDNTGTYSLKMSGKADKITAEFVVELDFNIKMPSDVDDSLPLHRLAAKRKLSEMEIRKFGESKIDTLSIDVNIPCRHTAFVGVDKEKRHPIPLPPAILERTDVLRGFALNCSSTGFKLKRKVPTMPFSGLMGKVCGVFRPKKKKSGKALARRMSNEHRLTGSGLDQQLSKIVQLVEKQNFDGSWKLDKSLCKILGKPLGKIKEATVVKDMDVWITAMVIAFFRKEFSEQKAEWDMIEEKAVQWLKTRDLEEKDVIQEALTFLSS